MDFVHAVTTRVVLELVKDTITAAVAIGILSYLLLIRSMRYRRMENLQRPFKHDQRPLSSMTAEEAHQIVNCLQRLEFPSAFSKARQMALLKVQSYISWFLIGHQKTPLVKELALTVY